MAPTVYVSDAVWFGRTLEQWHQIATRGTLMEAWPHYFPNSRLPGKNTTKAELLMAFYDNVNGNITGMPPVDVATYFGNRLWEVLRLGFVEYTERSTKNKGALPVKSTAAHNVPTDPGKYEAAHRIENIIFAGDEAGQLVRPQVNVRGRVIHIVSESYSKNKNGDQPVRAVDGRSYIRLFDGKNDPYINMLRLRFISKDEVQGGPRDDDFVPRNEHRIAKGGVLYPYRGRGPVWLQNSCSIDTVIVAARLLNVGKTTADLGSRSFDDWRASLSNLQRDCLDAFYESWNLFTREESIAVRHGLYKTVIDELNKVPEPGTSDDDLEIVSAVQSSPQRPRSVKRRLGAFFSANAIWDICTSGADQFSWRSRNMSVCSGCGDQVISTHTRMERSLTISAKVNDKKETPTMERLLNRHFAIEGRRQVNCRACGKHACRAVTIPAVESLPPRLVVRPGQGYRDIRSATNDLIEFQFRDALGHLDRAVYRWLGGIYQADGHYRCYWTDSPEYYADMQSNIRIYDGQIALGAIIGGVAPESPAYKVPREWSLGTDLLFYERLNAKSIDEVVQRLTDEVHIPSTDEQHQQTPDTKEADPVLEAPADAATGLPEMQARPFLPEGSSHSNSSPGERTPNSGRKREAIEAPVEEESAGKKSRRTSPRSRAATTPKAPSGRKAS